MPDELGMTVRETIAGLDRLHGSAVTIEGFIVEIGQDIYVAPGEESWDRKDLSIRIDDPSVGSRLMSTVPMWVGGPSAYRDRVSIAGVVSPSDAAPFPAMLRHVSLLSVTREGQVFQVIP